MNFCKDSASEHQESLLSMVRVQPVFCKDSFFSRFMKFVKGKFCKKYQLVTLCFQQRCLYES